MEINKGRDFYVASMQTDAVIEEMIFQCAKASRLSHRNSVSDGGAKDITLLSKLVRAGDEHSKALRGVNILVEVLAPRYWYHEMATYRMGCEQIGSESTMHGQDMVLNGLVDIEPIIYEDIHVTKSNIPEGLMQRRMYSINYQALRHIYYQRKNHKLREWKWFCEWIEGLPFAKELITCGKE